MPDATQIEKKQKSDELPTAEDPWIDNLDNDCVQITDRDSIHGELVTLRAENEALKEEKAERNLQHESKEDAFRKELALGWEENDLLKQQVSEL